MPAIIEQAAEYWIVFPDHAWKFLSQYIINPLSRQSFHALGSRNLTYIDINIYKYRICIFVDLNPRQKNADSKHFSFRSYLVFSKPWTEISSTQKRKKVRRKRKWYGRRLRYVWWWGLRKLWRWRWFWIGRLIWRIKCRSKWPECWRRSVCFACERRIQNSWFYKWKTELSWGWQKSNTWCDKKGH